MKLWSSLVAAVFVPTVLFSQANLWLKRVDPVSEYFRVPMLNSPSLAFSGVVENIGDSAATMVTVTVQVYNSVSSLVHTGNSGTVLLLLPGDSISFSSPAFLPPGVQEKYIVKYTATMSETDPDTSDNVVMPVDTFYVTDTVFARDNDESYVPIATGGNAGGYLGQQLVLNQPAMLTSISAFLTSPLPCEVQFVVFGFNGIPGWVPIGTSDTVQLGAVPLWVTLPMTNPVYLSADTFIIAVRQFTSMVDLNLSSRNPTFGTTWVRWQAIGGWHNLEEFGNEYALPFMIRANLDFSVGVTESGSSHAFDVFPNPADQTIVLTTQPDQKIEITNALGQVVSASVSTGTTTAIDISTLAPGMYFVSVYGENERTTQQLIVE